MNKYSGQVNSKLLIKILFLILLLYAILNFNQIENTASQTFNQYFTYSSCDKPIIYTIGSVDPKFNLSTAKFIDDNKQAADIWNKVEGKTLLSYGSSDSATLTINLIFDSRSQLSNQINTLEGQVSQKDQSLQSQISAYQQQEAGFKQKLADFNSQVANLNQQISSWNIRGGAPADIYQQLINEQNNLTSEQTGLQSEADNLNQTAKNLNLSTENYNLNVNNLNNTISSFDQALANKPEEGLYDPNTNTISIYFANNQDELIHTLTHEMGHSLGLDHNQNPQSIMYPYTTKSITPSADDISALNAVCAKRYFSVSFLGFYSQVPLTINSI